MDKDSDTKGAMLVEPVPDYIDEPIPVIVITPAELERIKKDSFIEGGVAARDHYAYPDDGDLHCMWNNSAAKAGLKDGE